MTETSGHLTVHEQKTTVQLCAERAARVNDAFNLRQPDRVPILLMFGHLIADLAGITRQEMYENPAVPRLLLRMRLCDFNRTLSKDFLEAPA